MHPPLGGALRHVGVALPPRAAPGCGPRKNSYSSTGGPVRRAGRSSCRPGAAPARSPATTRLTGCRLVTRSNASSANGSGGSSARPRPPRRADAASPVAIAMFGGQDSVAAIIGGKRGAPASTSPPPVCTSSAAAPAQPVAHQPLITPRGAPRKPARPASRSPSRSRTRRWPRPPGRRRIGSSEQPSAAARQPSAVAAANRLNIVTAGLTTVDQRRWAAEGHSGAGSSSSSRRPNRHADGRPSGHWQPPYRHLRGCVARLRTICQSAVRLLGARVRRFPGNSKLIGRKHQFRWPRLFSAAERRCPQPSGGALTERKLTDRPPDSGCRTPNRHRGFA